MLAASCSRPLPEADSPQAKLYVQYCGGCHRPYQPHALTASMWRFQVERMDKKFRPTGVTMPDAAQREQILAYLTRHAGQ